MNFEQLNLIQPLLKALETEGYTTPTPIQELAIPPVLQGKDLIGCAQTGTGKTAAFALPVLQLLHQSPAPARGPRSPRVLVLSPTRELAVQINESFISYGRHTGIKSLVIFGGVSQHAQTQALRNGTDVLIATPGRLLDLLTQNMVSLSQIKTFILDEADRMLDMGFINDVYKIVAKLPQQRQTLFFSATMPAEIIKLSRTLLNDPVRVEVTPISSTAEKVDQSVYHVSKNDKKSLLLHLLEDASLERVVVFSRTKHGADKIVKGLRAANVSSGAIHGNKSQNERQRVLTDFKTGRLKVMVATDIAARGIDVDALSHVINFDLPNIPETYVHRIGRTGRAGASGIAYSFCDEEEQPYLNDIQKLIGKKIPVNQEHPYHMQQRPQLSSPAVRNIPSYNGRKPYAQGNGNGNARRGMAASGRRY